MANTEEGPRVTAPVTQESGVCSGEGHQEHLFPIHPAEDTLFGASEIKGSRNLDQTLGGGGKGKELAGNEAKLQLAPSKTRAFFPLSRKAPLLPCLPQIGTSYILSWFPRALLPCRFQRRFLLMSKPRPDIIKCTPRQDKQAPVQSLP